MKNLLERLNILINNLKLIINTKNLSTPQGQKIYETALTYLGTDASPSDIAPDELGCAESVSDILIKAGFDMNVYISTAALYGFFTAEKQWEQVDRPLAGDVVISPTGMGGKNGITNGHVGIMGNGGVIMSNSSATGTFEANYTLNSWTNRYKIKGGYPICFFRRVL